MNVLIASVELSPVNLSVHLIEVELGEPKVVMNRADARKIGIVSNDRVKISFLGRSEIVLVSLTDTFISEGQLAVFVDMAKKLNLSEGCKVTVEPSEPRESINSIKKKLSGAKLGRKEIDRIVKDVYSGALSAVELTAFVLGVNFYGLDMDEIEWLTRSMASVGNVLDFGDMDVVDVHSVGGVPGNSKNSLAIVPIVAASGLIIPKTSTRAITSPSGTVDTMEVLAPVNLGPDEIVKITKRVGGVITWGYPANLSPVDATFIESVEYPLGVDPEPLIYASVLSKKYAVGAKKLVIDIPTGPEAKVEDMKTARTMARRFMEISERLGIRTHVAISYGGQPVGRCIGPALEAMEALEVMESCGKRGSGSFVEKSVGLAGLLLEIGSVAPRGKGYQMALSVLESGKAYEKFMEIVEAQGGRRMKADEIEIGEYRAIVRANTSGYVTSVSNRAMMRIARTAGAPNDKKAGIRLLAKRGDKVEEGDPLFELYSSSESKLDEALKMSTLLKPFRIESMILEVFGEVSTGSASPISR